MTMKGYSYYSGTCACARLEGVNASYKDLAQVCGRIKGKRTEWVLDFLERAAEGEIPVLYKRHNKNLGHRRELGGQKGRYPVKAAGVVLKVVKSAIANGKVLGLGETYTVLAVSANKKEIYPRMAPKGRQARSCLETSRIEIVLQGEEVPKGVKVVPPAKKAEEKKPAKPEEKEPKIGEEKKTEPAKLFTEEGKAQHEHKHEVEKEHDLQKKRKEAPHQHGEYEKR